MEDLIATFRAQAQMTKTTTDCCALCQLSRVNNNTPVKVIEAKLAKLKIEMEANEEVGITTGNGQTAVFTIVSPGEHTLNTNLKSLGFQEVWQFPRRKGYPETGELKLMIKNL
jgi:hypothetical protein